MRWLEALGVFRSAPDARPRAEIEHDLDAEFEHHLACLRDDLIQGGVEPEAAEAQARLRFGNPRPLRHECLHIRIGERIMLQRLHVATTVIFALAILWLGFVSHTQQAAAAQALEEAQRSLAQLNERLTPPPPAVPEPVDEIILQVGDRLSLSGPLDMEGEVALDGRLLVRDVGWFRVAGLTRPETESLLTEALRPYYADVDRLGGVTVQVER